jgi:diguanylate cyclase (GGDEF)-like protein
VSTAGGSSLLTPDAVPMTQSTVLLTLPLMTDRVPRPVAVSVRVLATLLVAGTLAYAAFAISGLGSTELREGVSRLGSQVLLAGAVALVIARAAIFRAERAAWIMLAVGLTAWLTGNVVYWVQLADLAEPPFPSLADAGYLLLLPALYAAIVLLVRARVRRFPVSVWLDGAIGASAIGALAGALVFQPVLDATSGTWAAVATNLAYPLGDMLLLGFVAGVFALSSWRPGRTWALLAAGVVVFAVGDLVYLLQVATGAYATGGAVDVTWPAGGVLMALAAWQRPGGTTLDLTGWRVLVVPFAFTVTALGLLVTASFVHFGALPSVLAGLTGLVTLARTALTFREVRALADSRRQALTDDLTGLGNRRALYQRLEEELAGGRPFAVLMLDLDRFKELNDTLGHHAGDRVLVEVARRLDATTPAAATVVRMGGDEFAVVAPGNGRAARAVALADALRDALSAPVVVDGLNLSVDASAGVALAPEHGDEAGTLLQRADVAMYQAKGARTGTGLYEPASDHTSRDALALVGELKHALAAGELVVHYQPQVELATGAVAGVEALVRWAHPQRGLLGPDAFIPLAEHTGLIGPITQQVLDTALADCARWRAAGDELTVAVNLAAANLLDAGLPAAVGAALERHDVPPHALVLEITESDVLTDAVRAAETVAAVRALGVAFSLDDFGTGYSSLSHLRRLPVDEVKIDRSFVMTMTADGDDAVIVRSTIDLARNLQRRVVAEGVEDEAVLALLRGWGCDVAQGYLFARPLPAAELAAWVAARRLVTAAV